MELLVSIQYAVYLMLAIPGGVGCTSAAHEKAHNQGPAAMRQVWYGSNFGVAVGGVIIECVSDHEEED